MNKKIIYIVIILLAVLNFGFILVNLTDNNASYMVLDKNNIWRIDKKVKKF